MDFKMNGMYIVSLCFSVGERAGRGPEIEGAARGREEVLPVPEDQAPPRPVRTGRGETGRAGQGAP